MAHKVKTCMALTELCKTLLEFHAEKRGISQVAIVEQAVREIAAKWDSEPQIATVSK